jgi:hypothetical protein
MILPTIRLRRAGEPGTLGAVCKRYFDTPKHEGCPFQMVCPVNNGPVEDNIVLRILYSTDAETLEAMAKAIRAIEEDGVIGGGGKNDA